jgi:hypothetical protein
MPLQALVGPLLTQLCEELGFCSALRAISRFPEEAMAGPDDFVDAVFAAEGLSQDADKQLAAQVRSVVDKHFALWQKPEDV